MLLQHKNIYIFFCKYQNFRSKLGEWWRNILQRFDHSAAQRN